jgi:hypothetical protein
LCRIKKYTSLNLSYITFVKDKSNMAIEFYDLKLKKKVQIDESKVKKVTFDTKSGVRYGLKAVTDDGRKLTKFVGKATWEELDVPVGE